MKARDEHRLTGEGYSRVVGDKREFRRGGNVQKHRDSRVLNISSNCLTSSYK